MTAEWVIGALVVLVIVQAFERHTSVTFERMARTVDEDRNRETIDRLIAEASSAHDRQCDRLMAKSLAEVKAWHAPKTEENTVSTDDSWMRPDFAMPESVEDPRD